MPGFVVEVGRGRDANVTDWQARLVIVVTRLVSRAGLASLRSGSAEPAAPVEPVAAASSDPVTPVRRTVTITGRGAEGHLPVASRRPTPRAYDRIGFNPDRIAMWAVLLGILLIVAAATSAHA